MGDDSRAAARGRLAVYVPRCRRRFDAFLVVRPAGVRRMLAHVVAIFAAILAHSHRLDASSQRCRRIQNNAARLSRQHKLAIG